MFRKKANMKFSSELWNKIGIVLSAYEGYEVSFHTVKVMKYPNDMYYAKVDTKTKKIDLYIKV